MMMMPVLKFKMKAQVLLCMLAIVFVSFSSSFNGVFFTYQELINAEESLSDQRDVNDLAASIDCSPAEGNIPDIKAAFVSLSIGDVSLFHEMVWQPPKIA